FAGTGAVIPWRFASIPRWAPRTRSTRSSSASFPLIPPVWSERPVTRTLTKGRSKKPRPKRGWSRVAPRRVTAFRSRFHSRRLVWRAARSVLASILSFTTATSPTPPWARTSTNLAWLGHRAPACKAGPRIGAVSIWSKCDGPTPPAQEKTPHLRRSAAGRERGWCQFTADEGFRPPAGVYGTPQGQDLHSERQRRFSRGRSRRRGVARKNQSPHSTGSWLCS